MSGGEFGDSIIMQLKDLQDCKLGELVRIAIDQKTEWAIIGADGNALFNVLVLTGPGGPRYENIAGEWGLKQAYEGAAALSYGHEWQLVELQDGECEVQVGLLFNRVGSIVIKKDARLMCCGSRFFDLKLGKTTEEPRGLRVAFGAWSIFLDGETKPVLSFPYLNT